MTSALDPGFILARPVENKVKGRNQVGERNYMAKLTEDEVRKIYADPRRGKERQLIAKEYGISVEAVKAIQYGRSWKHLNLSSK